MLQETVKKVTKKPQICAEQHTIFLLYSECIQNSFSIGNIACILQSRIMIPHLKFKPKLMRRRKWNFDEQSNSRRFQDNFITRVTKFYQLSFICISAGVVMFRIRKYTCLLEYFVKIGLCSSANIEMSKLGFPFCRL